MADATADAAPVSTPPSWMFVNDLRILAMLLAGACVVLVLGLALFEAYGVEHEDTVDVLLGTGVFLMLFCLLLFLPRLRSRGPRSFTLLVERSMDDVQEAVKAAAQESGRVARVEVARSRFKRPPRTVHLEGVTWRFTLRAAPYRERETDGTSWTEIVQSGFENTEDEVARDLRERILVRVTTSDAVST